MKFHGGSLTKTNLSNAFANHIRGVHAYFLEAQTNLLEAQTNLLKVQAYLLLVQTDLRLIQTNL